MPARNAKDNRILRIFKYVACGIVAFFCGCLGLMAWGNPLWTKIGEVALFIGFMELIGHFIVGMIGILDSQDGYSGMKFPWWAIAILEVVVLSGLLYAILTTPPHA